MPRRGSVLVKRNFRRFLALTGTALIVSACSVSQSESDTSVNSAVNNAEYPLISPYTSPSGTYLAGLVAGHSRDYSVAADLMLHALRASPENPQLLARSFLLTASVGRDQEAIDLAKRLLVVSPDQALAHLVLLIDAVKREDWDLSLIHI